MKKLNIKFSPQSLLKKVRSLLLRLVFLKGLFKKLAFLRSNRFTQSFKTTWPWLALFLAIFQVAFAVRIYAFHGEDRATRLVSRIIPYPIAIVNYKIISYNRYLIEREYIYHFYKATQQENANLKQVDAQVLDQLVENQLFAMAAWRNGIKISNNEIDQTINTIMENNGGQEKVEKVLSDLYGLKLDSFKKLIKNQLIREKLNRELITRVTARHILLRVDKDAATEKVDEVKARIEGYLKEARGGADFAELAKKYSEDVGSNEQGGLLEPFSRGEMVPEFNDTAFNTAVGSISDPIRTDFGWHIIKVESKKGKVDKKFGDWYAGVRSKSIVLKLT